MSVRNLISTLKKKKKSAGGEWIVEHSPKFLASKETATTTQILSESNAKANTSTITGQTYNKFTCSQCRSASLVFVGQHFASNNKSDFAGSVAYLELVREEKCADHLCK